MVSDARNRRAALAAEVAARFAGVAHRRDLRAAGIDRGAVRFEVAAGRWQKAGRHTVVVGTQPVTGQALMWRAVWETGAGAVLDGAAALVAHGLRGFRPDAIDVAVPADNRRHAVDGVRCRPRRELGPTIHVGVPRTRVEHATIRAAQWARSDRQAALIICLVVQQRLVPAQRLLDAWRQVRRSPRRRLIDDVVRDVCDGAHSLGELDFGRLCRRHGLPPPDRQVVRTTASGRIYLDVWWEDVGLAVEIDGGHHAIALNPVDDALRQNEVVIAGSAVLRIPVIGLRIEADRFMDQVVRAHRRASAAAA